MWNSTKTPQAGGLVSAAFRPSMLFRLRSELFSSVVSAALAFPMKSVCNTTKRDGNQ